MRKSVFSVFLPLFFCFLAVAAAPGRTLTIDVVDVGEGWTFQSHNQKVVANDNGIFLTSESAYDHWSLWRSTDGGKSFVTIYRLPGFQGIDQSPCPTLETDEHNDLYVSHPFYSTSQLYFLRFFAGNGYTVPEISIFNGVPSAGKSAMAYDRLRQQFYIATTFGRVLTVDKEGNLLRDQQVWSSGLTSSPQYPHLFVDADNTVHHAHTMDISCVPYGTIQYIKSTDGGATWQAIDGTPLSIPITTEWTGPSTMISLDGDEITPYSTWLGEMHAKDGKVHFAYQTNNPWSPECLGDPPLIEPRHHYMRFNGQTGVREFDIWPDPGYWRGTDITIHGSEYLLASDPGRLSSPLYAVGGSPGSFISALVSYDNGLTWHDYATTKAPFYGAYSLGGCRQLTPDGKVIGSFTETYSGSAKVRFFSFPGAKPAAPTPADGGFGQGPSVVLSWTGPPDTVYDVYFGPASDSLSKIEDDLTSETTTVDLLADATEYFWRVDAYETDGTLITQGDLWSFTTTDEPWVCVDPLPHDFNGDCRVDLNDLIGLATDWLTCGRQPVEDCH